MKPTLKLSSPLRGEWFRALDNELAEWDLLFQHSPQQQIPRAKNARGMTVLREGVGIPIRED